MTYKKILIIRFSSFGDIVQNMAISPYLSEELNRPEVHWLTKESFKDLIGLDKSFYKVWYIKKNSNIRDLILIGRKLYLEGFDLVFDAHCNTRTFILKILFNLFNCLNFLKGTKTTKIIVRSKNRIKRLLLFWFKINLFPKPFIGVDSYLGPLGIGNKKVSLSGWEFPENTIKKINDLMPNQKIVSLVPSAAWEMKRWPLVHWKNLVEKFENEKVILLGGPDDYFIEEIAREFPNKVIK